MNQQARNCLQDCINDPDFLYISGSKLYGCSREGSDDDLRGFVVPPKEYLFGIYPFEQYEDSKVDTKIYSLKKFLGLLANGDPQSLESLFVPSDKILRKNHIYDTILRNRSIFLSKTIYKRLMGFGYSEYSKAMCQKKEFEKLPLDHDALRCQLVDFCRSKNADKEDTDDILEKFDSFRDFKIVSSVSNLGEKRKKDHEKHGFCTSSMSHCIRLASQLDELLTTGIVIFPRPDASFLRDIRNGHKTKEECSEVYLNLVEKCKASFATTTLPDKANADAIDELYYSIVTDKLKN